MDRTLDILANSGEAMFAVKDDQIIVHWNSVAESVLGFTSEQAVGQPCWALLQGVSPNGKLICQPNCPIRSQIFNGKSVPHFDLWVINQAGEQVRTNISTIAYSPQNGDVTTNQPSLIHLLRLGQSPAITEYKLNIRLLGPIQVWRADGTQVGGKFWQRAKVRSLLAYLALLRGKPASREELIEVLWPEMEHDAALHNLNTTIYNLRRSLEPTLAGGIPSNYIFYESGRYWLGGDQPHWLDIEIFKTLIKQARGETAVTRAITIYQEAIQLYRGDYLADISDIGHGIKVEQNRLHQLFLTALEELGTLYQREAQLDKARDVFLKVLTLDPNREAACQQLARINGGDESRIDLLAYCQRLAASLKEELDQLLSAELLSNHRESKKTED